MNYVEKNSNLKQGFYSKVKLNFGFTLFTWLLLVLLSGTLTVSAKDEGSFISGKKAKGDFTLSASGKSAPLFVSSKDYPGVIRALKDLQSDIFKVTNAKPEISTGKIPSSKEIVIVGTLGQGTLVDELVKEKKINVDSIEGKWDAYKIQVVDNPVPNVDRALVIAGSNKRGTIFGIYNISSSIGVSPWYWWADVPVKKQASLFVNPVKQVVKIPAVKYRGIFINDEAPALSGWTQEKFGGFNHKFYEKVFELILRLKGNFLWPAMWGHAFNVDDTLNPKLADEYGIVMSTSHAEPMMRAQAEWDRFGRGPWNYSQNDSVLREYWKESIKRMNSYESVITIGMRGNGDIPMSDSTNISLLEKIVKDQRDIIREETGKDPSAVPQVWALYKEVQDYYERGMRVPEDVTLLLSDDNWGNIRMLPKLDAKPRKGGYGIYYHYDYVGGPRNYKWLNTNQIERVWEQMHLAYQYGAKEIWVVNVGDIKPMEFPISFFLDYAWNPDKWPAQGLPEYYKLWAEQQFGSKYAEDIADILAKYTKYNALRKPELLSPETYSLTYYREAESIVSGYNKLAEKAEKINKSLPAEYKDAYFQLVLYPVLASSNLNDLYVTVAKNRLYAKEGRALTNSLANKARELYKKDAELSNYYNKTMAQGKWDHMMDQTHIGYTYWQQPDSNKMPDVKEISLPSAADMGISVEGSAGWRPNDTGKAALPAFDPYNQQKYYIDIFNRGKMPFEYSIKTGEPWVKISEIKGKIEAQKRVWVSVDWKNVPAGMKSVPITISGPNKTRVVVEAEINNPVTPKPNEVNGFVESNGYVSIEAEHYSKAVGSSSITWLTIPNLGRTSSAVTPVPVTSGSQTPGGNSPHLEYNVYMFSKGEVKVQAYFSPTLNFLRSPHGIRYAISFDDEKPQILKMTTNPDYADLNRDNVWARWVSDNINIQISKFNIEKAGEHVLKFWMVDPGVDLQKIVIDAGGEKASYLGPPESFHHVDGNVSIK